MRRRDFVLSSGSAILTSTLGISQSQRPAVGLDFELANIPDRDPSNVDRLVVDFNNLEITPQYLDESKSMSVISELEVDGQGSDKSELDSVSVTNGTTEKLASTMSTMVVNEIGTGDSIFGTVTVTIDHPDIQDRYRSQFNIIGSEIPNSDVYIQDDWGDSKLQNRDGSGATIQNGVDGIYRPEWAIESSTATANNKQLDIDGGVVRTNINLDPSQTITWEWTGLNLKDSGEALEQVTFGCFMDDSSTDLDGSGRMYDGDGVYVAFDPNNGTNGLNFDTNTMVNHSIEDTTSQSNIDSVKVVRRAKPEWELFINGSSVGKTTDTTNAGVGFIYFADRQDGHTVDTVIVS